MKTTYLPEKGNCRMVAHRGLSGIERENTIPAFVAAGNRSYFGMECDVHVTLDGKYIVYHDDRTGRLCDKDLLLEESTSGQIRSLRIRDAQSDEYTDSRKLPYLKEYLAVCSRYEKTAVIELKNPMTEEHIAEIIKTCESEYDANKIIYISFCFENLITVRKMRKDQAVQFLCDKCDAELIARLREYKFGIDILYTVLNEELVCALHAAGVKINCWTCDDPAEAKKLIGWGVDYITTNILE